MKKKLSLQNKAQNIDLILEVAKLLKENEEIQFIIFGEGSEKKSILEKLKQDKLENLKIFPLQPYDKVSSVYSMADVSIVICKKGFGGISIPSKTWTIMATGTPIIASFDEKTELQEIIEKNKIGLFVQAENVKKLKQAIVKLYEDKNLLEEYGKNAKLYIEKNLTKEQGTKQYVNSIEIALRNNERKNENV